MIPVRKTIELKEGVKADLLFTPHLAVYEEPTGVKPTVDKDAGTLEVMYRYADLMYLAAINAWELDGHGTLEDFPHTRGDFHALMQADPKGFAAAVKFAVSALTGKTAEQLMAEERKKEAEQKKEEPVKKKTSFFSRIMRRSKPSLSDGAERVNGKRR